MQSLIIQLCAMPETKYQVLWLEAVQQLQQTQYPLHFQPYGPKGAGDTEVTHCRAFLYEVTDNGARCISELQQKAAYVENQDGLFSLSGNYFGLLLLSWLALADADL
jgi:hypothetical protein